MIPVTSREAARKIERLPPQNVTVNLWLTGWREFFPGRRNERSEQDITLMTAPFIRAHGKKLLTAVSPLMAQRWAMKHPHQVKPLRASWEKAVAMQIIPYNVWKVVEFPKREHPPGYPVPKQEELDAALRRCRDKGGWWLSYADIIELTAYTGARSGGICSLRRSAVDLRSRRVTVREKGGKVREVALLGPAQDAAKRALYRSVCHEDFLLFHTKWHRPHTRESLGAAWRAVRGDFPGPFHSLKHFAATWLSAQGADERDIAIQLGHFDRAGRPNVQLVRRVYNHPSHEDALARIEAIVAA